MNPSAETFAPSRGQPPLHDEQTTTDEEIKLQIASLLSSEEGIKLKQSLITIWPLIAADNVHNKLHSVQQAPQVERPTIVHSVQPVELPQRKANLTSLEILLSLIEATKHCPDKTTTTPKYLQEPGSLLSHSRTRQDGTMPSIMSHPYRPRTRGSSQVVMQPSSFMPSESVQEVEVADLRYSASSSGPSASSLSKPSSERSTSDLAGQSDRSERDKSVFSPDASHTSRSSRALQAEVENLSAGNMSGATFFTGTSQRSATNSQDHAATSVGSSLTNTGLTQLHKSFEVKPRKWYKPGRVFTVLWTQPTAPPTTSAGDSGSVLSSEGYYEVRFGEYVFSKPRKFVVVRNFNMHCVALPITTYKRRGVARKDVVKAEHGIIYTGKMEPAPKPRDNEVPRVGSTELPMQEIAIHVTPDLRIDVLYPTSRIVYSKPDTIEHNVRVQGFGMVNPTLLETLLQQYRDVQAGANR